MFSIVTPTLNSIFKLKRCIGSVRGQHGVNKEHIVKDGLSADGTPEWLNTQEGLKVYSSSDNGMYSAIEEGWDKSEGSILSWLNSDEQYLPGSLKIIERTFDHHPEVDVVTGNVIVVNSDGLPIAARREVPLRKIYISNSFLNVYSCTIFFRRTLIEKGLLRFQPGLRYAADMELVLNLLSHNCKFLHLNQYLSLFGVDGNNLSIHKGMEEETVRIRKKYGGENSAIWRLGCLLFRRLERLIRGGYRRIELRYYYALDEIPTYRLIKSHNVGGRFTIPRQVDR
jgi:glycosyltransferase involved in cell wall biosynthesis